MRTSVHLVDLMLLLTFIGQCRWAGGAVDDQTGVRVL